MEADEVYSQLNDKISELKDKISEFQFKARSTT